MLIQPFTVTENIILGMEPVKGLTVDKGDRKKEEGTGTVRTLWHEGRSGCEGGGYLRWHAAACGDPEGAVPRRETLILDEPTASLTPQEIEGALMEIISNLTADGKSVILITHKLKEITASSDNCTIIRQGKYIQTVKVADVDENALAAMMVGRDVNFKVDKKDQEAGEVVLHVEDLHAKDYPWR